jgi:C-methyltransferase-like protein/putative zinc binding protein/methyltransferase family protein
MSPLANNYLTSQELSSAESFYPLRVRFCDECLLVQAEDFESPETIFSDYAYFSSYSETWLQHARTYVDGIATRLALSNTSQVIEVASNDGYLLQYFQDKGIPVLGIEPAANVAEAAIKKGVPTRTAFFGVETARRLVSEGLHADLLIGNNVLAHVPEINDFVQGLKLLLARHGTITMEFPHLLRLIAETQFDTIYHEHFSYFSLLAVERIFSRHGLTLFDVEELATHGGSLRIYACHADNESKQVCASVRSLREKEVAFGINRRETYFSFADRVKQTKRSLLSFLIEAKKEGKSVAGYGAPAKGNTLLNYCGVGTDFIDYTVDRNPHKQGHFLPGTHVPIYHPDRVADTRPDFLLILPWNLVHEVMEQMSHIRQWGGRFVVPIPEVKIYS